MTDNTPNIDMPLEGTTWPTDTVSFTKTETFKPMLGKELEDAIASAEAYHNSLIDPLELIQELDKLQRYQNGVRFFPENLRRGQLKTKDVMAVIEKLMNR